MPSTMAGRDDRATAGRRANRCKSADQPIHHAPAVRAESIGDGTVITQLQLRVGFMTAASDILLIEHVVSADLDDGSPVVPGFVDDGIYWACVVRLPNARTLWRRIYLAETRSAGRRHGAPGVAACAVMCG